MDDFYKPFPFVSTTAQELSDKSRLKKNVLLDFLIECGMQGTNDYYIDMKDCISRQTFNDCFDEEKIHKADPRGELYKQGYLNSFSLIMNSRNDMYIAVTHATEEKEDTIIHFDDEMKNILFSAYPYKVCICDEFNNGFISAFADSMQKAVKDARYANNLVLQYKNRNEIKPVKVLDSKSNRVIGFVDIDSGDFIKNRRECLLSINAMDKKGHLNNDLYIGVMYMLQEICGEDYEQLDIRRADKMLFVIPDKYVQKVYEAVQSSDFADKAQMHKQNDFSLINAFSECSTPYSRHGRNRDIIEMPVKINTDALSCRMNDISCIPQEHISKAEFYISFDDKGGKLIAEYIAAGTESVKTETVTFPLSKNEQEFYKEKADNMFKGMSVDKMIDKSEKETER